MNNFLFIAFLTAFAGSLSVEKQSFIAFIVFIILLIYLSAQLVLQNRKITKRN